MFSRFPSELIDAVFDSLFANSWMLYDEDFRKILDLRLVCKLFDCQIRRCALVNLGLANEQEFDLIADYMNDTLAVRFLQESAKSLQRRSQSRFLSGVYGLVEAMVEATFVLRGQNAVEIDKTALEEDYAESLFVVALQYLETYGLACLLRDNSSCPTPSDMENDTNLLCAAAAAGNMDLVRVILNAGIDVNARSEIFGLPLYAAAVRGHAAIVEVLISSGANIQARNGAIPPMGCIPVMEYPDNLMPVLYTAAKLGHEAVVRVLLEKGARVFESRNYRRRTALHLAVSRGGNEGVVKALIEYGVEIGAKDRNGLTAMDLLCSTGGDMARKSGLKLMLEQGSSPENDLT